MTKCQRVPASATLSQEQIVPPHAEYASYLTFLHDLTITMKHIYYNPK